MADLPRIHRLIVGPLATNCYIVAAPSAPRAMIIDPGDDASAIADLIAGEGYQVCAILDTHGHADHIGANRALVERFQCPLMIHELDAPSLVDADLNLSTLIGVPFTSPPADRLLRDGDRIEVGDLLFEVIHTPGHTPGGICLYAHRVLFCGDTLFSMSIGRTDFPGGSRTQLLGSIRSRLFTLPDDTTAYPGHGPQTTIGWEKAENPFLTF